MIIKGTFCLDFNFYETNYCVSAFFNGHKLINKMLAINREGWFKFYGIN